MRRDGAPHRLQNWEVKQATQHRESPQETQYGREEATEQSPEAICLKANANQCPLEQDQHHTNKRER